MALEPGARLGPFEILSLLGAGGMGEVYRARDAKLNRDVAIKVLPELFTADPDRLARFGREAQLLASLNHPNYVRRLDQLQAAPLAGTEDAFSPFFSPDSQSIGFFAAGKLKTIAVTGGAAVTLCDAPAGRGGGGVRTTPSSSSPASRRQPSCTA